MPRRVKLPPAYPPRYYQSRWRGLGCMLAPLAFFGLFVAGFIFTIVQQSAGIWQWVGLALALLLFSGMLCLGIQSVRAVRIYPYYDQRLPGAETYLHGQALARNCLRLDALAKARGVKSISEFGFADPLAGETRPWHAAAEGLVTIRALLSAVHDHPESVDDAPRVLRELEIIREAFTRAQQAGVRFAFLLELGDGTSAQVWEIRQGHVC